MAELTAATPGTSGGDRPVGHWGWENFFLLESVAATFVATRPTISSVPTNRVLWIFGENYSTELVKVQELLTGVTSQFWTRFLLYEQV